MIVDATILEGPSGPSASPLDQQLIDRTRDVDVFVFETSDPSGAPRWTIDPAVADDQLAAIGERVIDRQRALYRAMARAGVRMTIGAAMGLRELEAFRSGTAKVLSHIVSQIESSDTEEPLVALDRWLLRHYTFFTSMSVERLVSTFIPERLPAMTSRAARLQSLLDAVDAAPVAETRQP